MPGNETVSAVSQPELSRASSTARGTVQLLAARCCFLVSGYLISFILARGLGPAEYGVYGVILSVLLWVELVGSAGLPGATAKFIPQQAYQAAAVEQTARFLLLVVSLALFALCWVLAPTVARLFDIPLGAPLFRLAILDLPFNGLYLAYQGTLYGHRRFGVLSVAFIVYSLTKLGGTLALLALGLSISGALLVNVLATVGALIYLTLKSFPTGWMPALALIPPMFRVALALGLYLIILQVLLSLDLWLLKSLWSGPAEVIGFYVAALNVARLPTVVPSVLSGVLFTSLTWALARADKALAQRYLQAAGRFTLIVLFPSCALVVMYAEPIMALLYSDIYATGGMYLRLQITAFGLMALLDAFLHGLMAIDKRFQSVGILLALIPMALLLNFVLVPQFGAMGAAASLVCTMLGGTAVAAFLTYRQYRVLLSPLTVLRVMAATAGIILLGSQINLVGLWLLVKLPLLLTVYVVILSLLQELSWQDLHQLAVWKSA